MNVNLEAAQQLAACGIKAAPTAPGAKHPRFAWSELADKTVEQTVKLYERYWQAGDHGAWAPVGYTFAVLDCDNEEALDLWLERIPNLWDTCIVATRKGFHFVYSIDAEFIGYTHEHDPEAIERGARYDMQGKGRGVMVPPSLFPDGPNDLGEDRYSWYRPWSAMLPLPAPVRSFAPKDSRATLVGGKAGKTKGGAGTGRSSLAELLATPPTQGGRNNWLNKAAGHYAKWLEFEDSFTATIDLINSSLAEPLDSDEWQKTARQAWTTEKAKGIGEANVDNGGLIGDGNRMRCPIKVEGQIVGTEVWADFDIEALGTYQNEDGEQTYLLRINPVHGAAFETTVEAKLFGEQQGFTRWVASFGSLKTPKGDAYANRSPGFRLRDYIAMQKPETFVTVPWLGDNDGIGFVTFDCIIRDGARQDLGEYRPWAELRNRVDCHYGFGPVVEARRMLAEVMTFHHPETTAVYGAWWALNMIKGAVMQISPVFPVMTIEAPSGHGKTNGFFPLMLKLAGDRAAHLSPTLAYLRDRLASHRNLPCWMDDITDFTPILDLIRQAASEQEVGKKGENRRTQVTVRLVGPTVISGESIQALHQEKALIDRSIALQVKDPTNRRSPADLNRLQWNDIQRLTQTTVDWQAWAGTYVAEMQKRADMLLQFESLKTGKGRYSDQLGLLRVGARMLADFLGEGHQWVIDEVEQFAQEMTDSYNDDDVLLTSILPKCLLYHTTPESPRHGMMVFVEGGRVFFHAPKVAEWWHERRGKTPREQQLGTETAIRKQALRAGAEVRRRSILDGRKRGEIDKTWTYLELPTEASGRVLGATDSSMQHVQDGKSNHPSQRGFVPYDDN